MKNKSLRLCLMLAVMLSLFSCRNDLFPENNTLQNPNASRFRMVKLKDIPNIEQFIHQQSGRADLQVPLSKASLTGKDLTIGTIETSTIVETVNGNEGYYVFKIDNMDSGDAVYNLEVKQADGIPVTAEIIEYDPQDGTTVDFQHFTGSISSYGLDGKAISTVNYNDGLGNCSPATGVPGGNNTSEGGGINPIDLPPPNGGWYNWGEGGSNNNTVPFSNVPGDCTDIILDSHGNTQGWYDHCNNNYYPNPNVHKTTTTGEIPNLSPDCNGEGAGVIITDPLTPCERLKPLLDPAKANLKPLITNGMYSYINNSIGEAGIFIKKDSGGNISTQVAPPSGDNHLKIKVNDNYYSAVHTHPKDTYPMFSYDDMMSLYTLEVEGTPHNSGQSSFILVCEDDFGVKQTYAIVFESSGQMVEEVWNNPENIGCSKQDLIDQMNKNLKKAYDKESEKSNPNYERVFLQFNFGTNIGLYKANSDLTNWSKLIINENSNTAVVTPVNCN
ncbi:hypothetical protein N0B16_01320 [Chryseobacterium sp. GMJ5]|uniref:DUF4329 domain-containing protein n=1 Tax=Chryseobacterium gilvum TaxID=2976534 RepID=A0ABT2VVD7_9FLAO|nr:hypothetical protein [Chryseobacterium gilvum]MCU7613069.1 hypothetical protein [Chryseobacterium gilvum]